MKKLFTIALALTALNLNAQFHVSGGVGYSPRVKAATVELFLGGTISEKLVLQVGYQAHVTQKIEGGALFQGRAGYEFKGSLIVTPYIGIANLYKSSDNKKLNSVKPLAGIEVSKQLGIEQGRLYLSVTASGRYIIPSVGLRFLFVN